MEWLEIIFKEKIFQKELKRLQMIMTLILISDLDEIPNLENFDYQNKNQYSYF